jgi:RES domain-containing protein
MIGTPCIYTSETKALSILEYAANVPLEEMPFSLSITVFTIQEKSWKEFYVDELPKNWSRLPAPQETKEWGSRYLQEAKLLALKLPSVIINSEFNFILNPLHSDFKKVSIKEVHSFTFDARIKQ